MGLQERGRQTKLGKQFQVSQQAARKWLDGRAYPETGTVISIANWAGVNVNWLLQGAGPKRGDKVDMKAAVIDEAIKALPRELGLDLVDNLRSKLERAGKVAQDESNHRFVTMLDSYEREIGRKTN
ncbi:MAG: hypothetical protein ABI433_11025 [Burkholderiaceae bacterium]